MNIYVGGVCVNFEVRALGGRGYLQSVQKPARGGGVKNR